MDDWSRTSLSESSYVQYDSENDINLPREYTANMHFDIRAQHFNRLGSLISDLIAIEHAENKEVQWVLTEETKKAQFCKLRELAAKNAREKARDYAAAVGYSKVTPIGMSEAQAHTRSSSRKGGLVPTDGVETTLKNRADAEDEWGQFGEEAFQYTPEEVKMKHGVNAKFRAEKA